jgi:hypothetical protein
VYNPNTRKEIIFAMLEQQKKLSLFGFRSNSSPSHSIFFSSVPLKAVKKKIILNIQVSYGAVAEYAK